MSFSKLYASGIDANWCEYIDRLYAVKKTIPKYGLQKLVKLLDGNVASLVILEKITEKHLLTRQQFRHVAKLWRNNPSLQSPQWVYNLNALGYEFSSDELKILRMYDLKPLLNKKMPFGVLCALVDSAQELANAIQKYDITIDDSFPDNFVNLLCAPNGVQILAPYFPHTFAFVEKLFSLCDFVSYPEGVEYLKKIFELGVVTTETISKFLEYCTFSQISLVLEIAHSYDVRCGFEIFQHLHIVELSDALIEEIDKLISSGQSETGKILWVVNDLFFGNLLRIIERYNTLGVKFGTEIFSYGGLDKNQISKIFEIANYTADDYQYILEIACNEDDEVLFDAAVAHGAVPTGAMMEIVYEHQCWELIKKMLINKITPQIGYAVRQEKKLLLHLIENGLPVNLDTLDKAMYGGVYLDNIENYGFDDAYGLYKLCWKYDVLPYEYLDFFRKDASLHLDFRNNMPETAKDFAERVVAEKIVPDKLIYANAVLLDYDEIVEYLENVWNFKPNISTLVEITNYNIRHKYLQRIIAIHDISHVALHGTENTVAEYNK